MLYLGVEAMALRIALKTFTQEHKRHEQHAPYKPLKLDTWNQSLMGNFQYRGKKNKNKATVGKAQD